MEYTTVNSTMATGAQHQDLMMLTKERKDVENLVIFLGLPWTLG